jgi:hypothetical protein
MAPMQTPFTTITDNGMTFTGQRPVAHDPHKHDYSRRPAKVAIHHDLTLEIHGEHFSTSTRLTVDDAMGLIMMLGYIVREHAARTPTK